VPPRTVQREVGKSVCTKQTIPKPLDSRVHLRAEGFPYKKKERIKEDRGRLDNSSLDLYPAGLIDASFQ